MKILQVTRQFYPAIGGVEVFVKNLCQHLKARGHSVSIVTLNRIFQTGERLPDRDVVEGLEIHRIPFISYKRIFLAPSVLKFVKDYDLVHVHNVDSFLDILSLTKRLHSRPLVLTTHGGFFHTRRFASFKRWYFRNITRLSMRSVSAVAVSSDHDLKLFSGIAKNIVRVHCGIDFSSFSRIDKNISRGLLLYVGRLAVNKRVENLIRTLSLIIKNRPEARLAIIGADFDGVQSKLVELSKALGVSGSVEFVGAADQETLYEYLSKSQLFVSASEYEAFGISVLEAMASGTVPVVNDIPAFREFIRTGENGFLVDFSKVDVAAKVILEIMAKSDDYLRSVGERARQKAREYAWENVVSGYEEVYRNVLNSENQRFFVAS